MHQRLRLGLELEHGGGTRGVQGACREAECEKAVNGQSLSNVAEQVDREVGHYVVAADGRRDTTRRRRRKTRTRTRRDRRSAPAPLVGEGSGGSGEGSGGSGEGRGEGVCSFFAEGLHLVR